MRPLDGRARVPTSASSVDLPDPFAPSTTDTFPGHNVRLTPTSARTGPNVFVTSTSVTPEEAGSTSATVARLGSERNFHDVHARPMA